MAKSADKNSRDAAGDPALPQKKRARRRLVGAIAIGLAAAVGLPLILDSEPKREAPDLKVLIPSRDAPLKSALPSSAPVARAGGATSGGNGTSAAGAGSQGAAGMGAGGASGDGGAGAGTGAGAGAGDGTGAGSSAGNSAVGATSGKAAGAPGVTAADSSGAGKEGARRDASGATGEKSGADKQGKSGDKSAPEKSADKGSDKASDTASDKAAKAADKAAGKAAEKAAAEKAAAESAAAQRAAKAAKESAVKDTAARNAAAKAAAAKEAAARDPKHSAKASEKLAMNSSAKKYLLQVGAFSSDKGATDQADRVKATGLRAFTEKVKTADGERIRVRVGPFATRDEAEQARGQLKLSGIDAALITP